MGAISTAARERLASHYLKQYSDLIVRRKGAPPSLDEGCQLRADFAMILQLLGWAWSEGSACSLAMELGWRFPIVLDRLVGVLPGESVISSRKQMIEVFERGIEAAEGLRDGTTRLKAQCAMSSRLGQIYLEMGQIEKAKGLFSFAFSVARETADPGLIGGVARTASELAMLEGRYEEAEMLLVPVDESAPAKGHSTWTAETSLQMAKLCRLRNNHLEAIQYYRQALSVFRELGQNDEAAEVLEEFGSVSMQIGNFREAHICYEHSLKEHERLGLRHSRGRLLTLDGTARHAMGELDIAEQRLTEGLQEARSAGDSITVGRAHLALGDLSCSRGDPERGLQWYESAHQLALQCGDVEGARAASLRIKAFCR